MISFDPYDPAHLVDGVPFDHLARVRAEQPVCPTPRGAWYLSRFSEVEAALKDVDTFRADLGKLSGLDGVEDVPPEQLFLSEITEPRHGRIRRVVNATFGPHRLALVEPYVEAVCHELVDRMVEADPADLHGAYALPIPGLVMARIMGLPPDASARFMAWSTDGSIMTRPCSPTTGPDGHPVHRFFAEQLAERRAARRAGPEMSSTDVFVALANTEIDGEPLTDVEIVTQLHFMVQAGVHTTRGLLTHLSNRPGHRRRAVRPVEGRTRARAHLRGGVAAPRCAGATHQPPLHPRHRRRRHRVGAG